ncbi:ADP,ATP carrier protein, mitochondrial [Capsicum chinense]|nr:ADP,ATP carrier protein, mitochondrial [Capsicum chinense]
MYDSLKPVRLTGGLQDCFFASFALGWLITNGAGLASFPIDTVRRRMMMTSGEAVKYKSSLDAFSQILKNEDPKSLVLESFVLLLVLVCWLDMINFR